MGCCRYHCCCRHAVDRMDGRPSESLGILSPVALSVSPSCSSSGFSLNRCGNVTTSKHSVCRFASTRNKCRSLRCEERGRSRRSGLRKVYDIRGQETYSRLVQQCIWACPCGQHILEFVSAYNMGMVSILLLVLFECHNKKSTLIHSNATLANVGGRLGTCISLRWRTR